MAIRVLGPLDTGTAPLSPRERVILSALVVRARGSLSAAELAEAYWGESMPSTWGQQVRTSIARIRQRLGREAVTTLGSEYRLGLDADSIDATQFERLVSTARQHALRGEDDRAIDGYQRALAMWRGNAYPDLSGWQPGVVEAMRLDEIRRSAEEELLDARLRVGDHRAVAPEAERLVRENPLREDRWAILALATYQSDRQAEALALLRTARRTLADELGIDPGRRLTDLETAVLRQDPALLPTRPMRTVSPECPYRGLDAFGPDDAELFFGREADVDQLVERARPGAVVAISGPSGSGKSSVLLAGVLPRLTSRGRSVRVLRPGAAGVALLRDAIVGRGKVDVLAIDQAEELLLAGGDVDAFCASAQQFVDSGGTVLLTIRSDFLDRATALPRVGQAVGRGVYVLGPLSDQGLRMAVEEPAQRSGLRLEPGLVEVVLRDTQARPATLPHLSHALLETWVRREGATLTVAGYEASGGIAGSIAQSAEDLYRTLPATDRDLCRALMMRLVGRLPEGMVVRRRSAAAPLLEDPDRRRVLERLVASRLVTADGAAFAVAHESVAAAWPRLGAWLDDDAEGARLMGMLTAAAEIWRDGGRSEEDLVRGGRLESLLEWRETGNPDLTSVESEFLDASTARQQDELRAVTERAARDRQHVRRLRAALTGAAALLVVALAAGGIAAVRNGQAAASRDTAQRASLVSTAVAVGARDPVVGALLAAEAYRRWPDAPGTRVALMSTMQSANGLVSSMTIPDVVGRAGTALIPGTRSLVVARSSGQLEVRGVDTGALERTLDPPLAPAEATIRPWMLVSGDGSTLAVFRQVPTPGDPGRTTLEPSFYDLRTGRRMGEPLPLTAYSDSLAISPDGRRVASVVWDTGRLVMADLSDLVVRSGASVGTGGSIEASAGVPAFTADGSLLVGTADGHILEIDPATLATTRSLGPWPSSTNFALVPLDDGTVIAAGQRGIVRVDLATGEALWHHTIASTHRFPCGDLAVSSEHGVVFCADTPNIVRRDLDTGEVVGAALPFTGGAIGELYLLDSDTLVATSAQSGVVSQWRIDGSGPASRIVAPGLALSDGYDPSGRYLVAGNRPAAATVDSELTPPFSVWDTRTGTRADPTGGSGDLGPYPSWIGPARLLTVDEAAGTAAVVDVSTGETSTAGDLTLDNVGFWISPHDGDVYAAYLVDGGVRVDVLESGTLRRTGETYTIACDVLTAVSFDADGSHVAFSTWQQGGTPWHTWVYDTRSGALLVDGLPRAITAALAPAGDLIAADESTVAVHDGRTLERRRALPLVASNVESLQVTRDGTTLAAWTEGDIAVTLYDLRSGERLGAGLPETAPDTGAGVALRPDGLELAYTVAQGVAVWDLDPAHQYEAACRIAGRELTADEWTTYLADLGPQRPTCSGVLGDSEQ